MVLGRFWTWYSGLLVSHPIRTNAVSALVIATIGDLTAQTLEAKYHPKLSHVKRHKAEDVDKLHHHLPLHPHPNQNFHVVHAHNENHAQIHVTTPAEKAKTNSIPSSSTVSSSSSPSTPSASSASSSSQSSSSSVSSSSNSLVNPIVSSTAVAVSSKSSTSSSSASPSALSPPLAVVSASSPSMVSPVSPIVDFFSPIEYRGDRLAQLALWGGFQAIPMHYWFSFLDRKFPSRALPSVLTKVGINQTCYAPLLNAAFFGYTIACDTGIVKKEERAEFWQRYKERIEADLWPTTKRSVTVWGSFHVLNFTFFPGHIRVVASAILGMFWITYLSLVGHDDGFDE